MGSATSLLDRPAHPKTDATSSPVAMIKDRGSADNIPLNGKAVEEVGPGVQQSAVQAKFAVLERKMQYSPSHHRQPYPLRPAPTSQHLHFPPTSTCPFFYPKTEPSYNRYTYRGCYTMLWDQTKQLPKELLKQVEEIYRDNFPLEVRLHLASWIEENFSPKVPFNASDPAHQKTAVDLANQLITHLNAKIAEMPNDPDKFLLKGKLGEIAEQLKVRKLIKRPNYARNLDRRTHATRR